MKKTELEALFAQMSLTEKFGQLTQTTGEHFLTEAEQAIFGEELVETGPSMEDLGFTEENIYCVGSVLGVSGAATINEIQRNYLAKSRLGIPLLFMHDAIHGYRTIFPIPLALASSFDRALLERVAADTAEELRAAGIQVDFSPMTDLVRDARWGRVMESFGEDAVLSGKLGAAMIRGYQKAEHYVAACLKHFAAYGAADAGRDYASTDMSLKEFYGFYARTYELALQAEPDFVMSSFNSLNGEPATGSKWLQTEVLRQRYGFTGLVISDWAAVSELKNHGRVATDSEAGKLALTAGVDIEMLSNSYLTYGENWIAERPELLAEVDRAVMKQLELKNKLGLFESPYADEAVELATIRRADLVEAAKAAAKESCVLLKNEKEILPLSKDEDLLVIGPFAKTQELLGSWQCKGRFDETVSLETGLARLAKSVSAYESLDEVPKELLAKFDKVIVTLGEDWNKSGEGHSSANLELDREQQALVHKLKGQGKQIIALGFAGRPLALESVIEDLDALLWCWYLGNETGNAVAELLLGLDTPTGKLAMSFPRVSGQVPLRYNELRSGRPANESSYSSRYQDLAVGPLFSFGFGLGYGKIKYDQQKLSAATISAEKPLTISLELTNMSPYARKETVILYMEDPVSELVRPIRELLDFKRVNLNVNEKRELQFQVRFDDLKYVNNQGEKQIEAGLVRFYLNDLNDLTKPVGEVEVLLS